MSFTAQAQATDNPDERTGFLGPFPVQDLSKLAPSDSDEPLFLPYDINGLTAGNSLTVQSDAGRPDFWFVSLRSVNGSKASVFPGPQASGVPIRLSEGGHVKLPAFSEYVTIVAESGSAPLVGTIIAIRGYPLDIFAGSGGSGDTAQLYTPAGRVQIATGSQNFGDGQSGPTFINGVNDGQFPLGVMPYFWNGASSDRDRTPNKFIDVPATAIVAGTPLVLWTPTISHKFRLMGWALYATPTTTLIWMDAAAILWHLLQLSTQNPGITPSGWDNGYLSLAANNALKLDVSTNATINGVVFGTEE